jgi:hypothetical protein
MGGAGGQQLAQVGEVVVDGQARDSGTPGDLGHGGAGDALLLVQLRGRPCDPVARLALALRAGL